jgi:hypothetical protein
MGVVYAAEDLKLGRTVALKFLPEDLAQDEKALARLNREAKAISKLDHPNVGTLFALETVEGGSFFLVMGFYDGDTLATRLHKAAPLDVLEATRIATEMARGLGHAHAHGVVHRDVKPGNVILAKQPGGGIVTKILDFGLARLEQSSLQLTRPGSTTGTPMYMAPEQVRGMIVDPKADIWAWGAVTYLMLSGQPPFDGPSIAALMMNVIQKEPVPLEELRTDVPPALAAAVMGALKKPLEERWQSMEDVLRVMAGQAPASVITSLESRGVVPEIVAPVQPIVQSFAPATPSPLEAMTDSDWPTAAPVKNSLTAAPTVTEPRASRPAWVLPLIAGIAVAGVGVGVYSVLSSGAPVPSCQPWARATERIGLAANGGLEWLRGTKTIFGSGVTSTALTDCGTFAYGAMPDVKTIYPGASKAERQVFALPQVVLTSDHTVGVKTATLEFPEALDALDNANSSGAEFYSPDKRFVFTAVEPTVPGVKYDVNGKKLTWSFYDYKLQPTQNFMNALQTLDVEEGAELIYPTGLPDDGSLTGMVLRGAKESVAVFFNFGGSSLTFEDVNVPPGIARYYITNLRPGAKYGLSFAPDRNWWTINLQPGGRYTVSQSGVLMLDAQPPKQ